MYTYARVCVCMYVCMSLARARPLLAFIGPSLIRAFNDTLVQMLEGMWKEAAVTYFNVVSHNFAGVT